MKANKAINIILIIVVISIWSTLGFRFFYSSSELSPAQYPTVEFKSKENFRTERKEKELVLSDKNAFRKYKNSNKNTIINPIIPAQKKSKEIVVGDTPNRISFHGSLTDPNGKKIYIIKLNGQIKRMNIGQKVGDVTILKSIKNGIQILDRKEKREVFEMN
ncbi:MAG: hypothetical protein ABF274_10520 [Nonlabens sp.]|uniref:hypothetical protein n=1 Tax=Nonlabens sp. TaxID=1888209 RepID=UPI0032191CA7